MKKPFRYDLNQMPNYYTVEVINRFTGLDLIDRVLEELWMEVRDIVQEIMIKTISKKRSKRQRRKGKIYPFECRVPKNSKKR